MAKPWVTWKTALSVTLCLSKLAISLLITNHVCLKCLRFNIKHCRSLNFTYFICVINTFVSRLNTAVNQPPVSVTTRKNKTDKYLTDCCISSTELTVASVRVLLSASNWFIATNCNWNIRKRLSNNFYEFRTSNVKSRLRVEWGLKYHEDLTKKVQKNLHLIVQKNIQILRNCKPFYYHLNPLWQIVKKLKKDMLQVE